MIPTLTLYSHPDCGPCGDLKTELEALALEFGWVWREINIAEDPALLARFGSIAPVVDVEQGPALYGRIRGEDLLAAVAEAQHG